MSESPRFRPLEEPLRWGDVLVMRSRAPLAARFRPRLLRLWPLFALGLAHAGIWSLSFRVKADFAGMDFEELAVIACMMCISP
ncbi:MAG: hypothetical protein BWZ10_02958 [candidate division BRC1 bacterium ADurb.BinA364]|nr:MAG: hypothetical protein BWZ10_02958 [candidate division BRC1 bacterium ADurb.BinA364]